MSVTSAKNLSWDHDAYTFTVLPGRSPAKDKDRAVRRGGRGGIVRNQDTIPGLHQLVTSSEKSDLLF